MGQNVFGQRAAEPTTCLWRWRWRGLYPLYVVTRLRPPIILDLLGQRRHGAAKHTKVVIQGGYLSIAVYQRQGQNLPHLELPSNLAAWPAVPEPLRAFKRMRDDVMS